LYDQAAPYIKDVIQLDSICNDSINWMYDLQLLGAIYLHAEKYPESKTAIHHARRLAHKVSPADTIQQDLYLAAIKYYNIETDSALTLIRDVPRLINPIAYNNAAAYAADIYLQANSLDSAYMYANELIHADATLDRITGYHTVLSSSLIHRIPTDSIIPYVLDYRISIASLLEQNGNQQALLQNSIYNYSIHERERQKAENTQLKLQRSIICILAIVSILIIGLFYLKYRNKVQLLQLHEALRNISALREELDRKDNVENLAIVNDNQEELRNQLRLELLSLQQSGNDSAEILHDIINHPTYHKLQQYIETNKIITDRDTIWGDIEKMVCTYSQNFKSRLMLLTNGKLTSDDYRIALLIKCGVTPTQLTKLFGRTKGTVSYKRSMLCMRIFDQKLGAKIIDDIIRLL
jgi:hypothetical protein